MSNLYSSFIYYCNKEGKKPSRVLDDVGISRSLNTRWKAGDGMSDATAAKLAKYFGVTFSEFANPEEISPASAHDNKYALLDEHGRSVVDAVLELEYQRCSAPPKSKVVEMPRPTIRHYLSRPAAGVGGMAEDDFEDIPLPTDAPAGADYCLTVSGDSMEPLINDGQMIYVRRDAELEPMDIGVFLVDGEAYVKHFFPGPSNQIYLVSANPARQDANIVLLADGQHTVYCAGKVLL